MNKCVFIKIYLGNINTSVNYVWRRAVTFKGGCTEAFVVIGCGMSRFHKMYIGNLKQSDEFHSLVLHTIRDFGIKHRHKKNHFSKSIQDTRHTPKGSKVFRRPLCALKTQNVTLKSGTAVEIPSFVVEACCHIKHHCNVEGIFRKAGSAARLREIKAIIDGGKRLESQHHVIDVSNILKLFFRELPEPLLPFSFHDLLLRCLLVKDKATEAILLTCLLFPSVHLNTLVYLMEFFREVANNEESNKMGITNLAIIITPSLMPVEEKIMNNGTRLGHHVRVIEILLHNTERIGFLPEFLIEKALNSGCVVSTSEEMDYSENDENKVKKKKKRRSGSLTRMINGLKKIVGKGSPDVNVCPVVSTPDFSSPCVKSTKKRKLQESSGAFSSKKKRDILRSLPQSVTLANAPCTPLPATIGELHYTPRVHSHPNLTAAKSESRLKSRLSVRKSAKKLKKVNTSSAVETDTSCRSEKEHRTSLDWQWKNGPWKRKKCLSSSDTPVYTPDVVADNRSTDSVFCSDSTSCTSVFDEGVDLSSSVSSSESEFVKIPKSEYEEIKNRVSAIENRISQEFGCIASNPINNIGDIPLIDESEDETCSAKKVQSAYEKTLEESGKLGDPISTDQLAKRLSKELKIRHSLENKIIRSPSARKIGTIRRRSRENARTSLDKMNKNNSPKHVVRHASLKQNPSQFVGQDQVFYAKSNLRRGRPNTVFSGLPHPSPLRVPVVNNVETPKMDFVFGQDSHQTDGQSLMVTSGKETSNSNMLCTESVKSSHTFEDNSNINTANRCEVRRASSFHGTDLLNSNTCDIKKSVSQGDVACTTSNCGKQLLNIQSNSNHSEWENGPQFFRKHDVQKVPISGRESVVKIRSQNAGMVLARMRLFDKKEDPNRTPSRVTYLHPGGEEKLEKTSIAVAQNNAQSLRIKCIQDNFLEKLNAQSVPGERRRSVRLNSAPGQSLALKGSPKKIGSPRKKYQSQKSPKSDNKKQKHKSSKSPQKEKRNTNSGNECNIKKCNSLRENLYRSPLASKINSTAPSSILNCGKENMSSTKNFVVSPLSKVNNENYDTKTEIIQQIHLPENLKETIYDVCTPRIEKMSKMSMSPLKDCNRIDVNATTQFESNRQNTYKTPRTSPFIKKPLLVKSPTELIRTPYCRTPAPVSNSHRAATPLKALPNLNACTPVVSYKQSSCVLREKSKRTVQT
ncbi:hypothetical protein R5R35_012150 [Gryllus longicercus]|uniref:Rho-GAP domain-containing protein n=1 Tax=Gryllus longicercus TaxID=2509291 RepID=A0AAN9VT54_9ORTH